MSNRDSLAQIEEIIAKFSKARDWDQFHTPKNLVMAATSEMGELAEVLQWKSDIETETFLQTAEGKQQLSEEIADVVIYLIRLCQTTKIDLVEAITSKILLNEEKYPIDKSKGNAQKYDKLN